MKTIKELIKSEPETCTPEVIAELLEISVEEAETFINKIRQQDNDEDL